MPEPSPSWEVVSVDDDQADQVMMRQAIASEGLTVRLRTLSGGAALLEHLAAAGGTGRQSAPAPRLVLLDHNMPGMDGLATLKALRAERRWRSLPVVVFSGSHGDELVQQVYEAGANSFIRKPDRFGDLGPLLRCVFAYWRDACRLAPPATDADVVPPADDGT